MTNFDEEPRAGKATTSTHRRPEASGPPLGWLAVISLALLIAGILVPVIMTGQGFVSPYAGTDAVVSYFTGHPLAARIAAMIQFGSAIPLGIYAATAQARLTRLGVRVPGPTIAFYGGITGSLCLLMSSMISWVLSHPEVSSNGPVAQALSYLGFVNGGSCYVVGSGLLVAGMAVPALIVRLLPRWLAVAGLVIAGISELSFLSLAVQPLQVLLPIGRFGGLLWLIAGGFLLPVTRTRTTES